MSKTPNNAFASIGEAPAPAAPVHQPAPKSFPGRGAEIHGRHGESPDAMADRMHPTKR